MVFLPLIFVFSVWFYCFLLLYFSFSLPQTLYYRRSLYLCKIRKKIQDQCSQKQACKTWDSNPPLPIVHPALKSSIQTVLHYTSENAPELHYISKYISRRNATTSLTPTDIEPDVWLHLSYYYFPSSPVAHISGHHKMIRLWK
jgi:hypothetical protein